MLTLWSQSPFWALSEFARDLDRQFEGREGEPVAVRPRYDVEEKEGAFLLSFEMPGVPKEKLQVELKENTLRVAGEGFRRHFQAEFTVPATVDTGKVAADYKDGILQIQLPKAEAAKPRQVPIGSGEGSARLAS